MKKIYAILCMVLILLCTAMSVSAGKSSPTLKVESVTVGAGKSVEVPLTLSNNTGICGATISISYDKALVLTKITEGDAFSEMVFTKPGDMTANPVNLVWDNVKTDNTNGTIAVLTFTAPTKSGTYRITASVEDGNVVDENLNPVQLTIVNGTIQVTASGSETKPDTTPTPGAEQDTTPTPEKKPDTSSVPVTEVFTDVYPDWYTDYVQYVYDNSLMTGIKGTTLFQPDANITKAQVAQVLYNMEGQPTVTEKKVFAELKDVYKGEWYENAVAWAYNTGVVTGDLNTKEFSPNANVTREQLALMLYRYSVFKGYKTEKTSDLAGLKNAENVSNWAADGVKWAVGSGLISGVEKDGVKDLAPQGNATRAQVAAILMRFCDAYGL